LGEDNGLTINLKTPKSGAPQKTNWLRKAAKKGIPILTTLMAKLGKKGKIIWKKLTP